MLSFRGGINLKENSGPGVGPGAGGVAPFGAGAAVYGVSWDGSSTPTLTRTDDSVGWTCQAGVDAGVVTNDADSAEIYSDITEVTDTAGNVFVRIPKFYIRKTAVGSARTWQITQGAQGDGYLPACFWDFTNGVELDYTYIGKYPASLDGTNLASRAGEYPLVNKTVVEFRNYAEANGAGYQQFDIHIHDVLQTLFYVEFATLNSQSIMAGYTAGSYNAANLLTADTSPAANALIVANATGALYAIGQAISVGTSLGGNQRFYGRTITNIEADTPGAGSTTVTFDDAAVEMFTGDILYNTGYKNGDAITATSGSVVSNSTGKHYCKYRGVISPWGNVWQWIDGVNTNDLQAWVCADHTDYESNLFASPYVSLDYVNHNANGYVVSAGYDATNPFVHFPTAVNAAIGNSAFGDYYYQTVGPRVVLVGGYWGGGSDAGLSYWSTAYASTIQRVNVGGRLSCKALI